MNDFGAKLLELRKERRLTQPQLAEQLNVGKSIISLWETNQCEPTLSKLVSIAKFFDVSIDYLVGIEK